MTKVFATVAIVLLSFGLLPADNAREDSLLSLVPHSQSLKRINIYLELSALKIKQAAPERALGYAKNALEIANDLNTPLQKAEALEACALAAQYQSRYQLAIEMLKNAYLVYSNANNDVGMAHSLNRLGSSYERLGNYLEALAAYQKSLTMEQKIGDRGNVAKVMNNLGIVYRSIKDYSQALTLFQKAREIAIQIDDSLSIVATQNNIGTVLLDLGRYDEALPTFLYVLELRKKDGNKYGMISAYDNLGLTHLRIGNLEKAAAYYFQGAELARQIKDKFQEAQGLNNLATVLTRQKKLGEATKFAEQAYVIAKRNGIKRSELEILLTLSDIKHKEGNDTKSRSLLIQHIHLKDSIFSQNLSEKVAEFQVKYELESQNQTNSLLNDELNQTQINTEKSKEIIYALLMGSVLVFGLLLVFLWLYRKRIKTSQKIASMNEELNRFNHSLEETVSNRTSELVLALKRAEESDKLKTAFLTNMSHEIRTPLNGIIGFSRMLEDELPVEIRRQYIDIISERGQHLLDIITDILNISKIESGQITVKKSVCQLNTLFDHLLLEYKQLSTVKLNDKLSLSIVKGLPDTDATIITDCTRLHEVISNLLDNALKFTEEGSIQLGYKLHENEKEILVWVKDTGCGISEDSKEQIFERFNQIPNSNGANKSGTGLGLAISKGLIQLLGGTIWVESHKGVGSTFFFTLPFIGYKTNNEGGQPEPQNVDHLFGGKTILVVEDDYISFQYLESILRNAGAALIHVKNGEDALEVCQLNTKVDLVLMDIQLPFMDGCETTRRIKLFRKNLPIIAQTADVMPEDKIRCFESGCDDFIGKPIDPDELVGLISKRIL